MGIHTQNPFPSNRQTHRNTCSLFPWWPYNSLGAQPWFDSCRAFDLLTFLVGLLKTNFHRTFRQVFPSRETKQKMRIYLSFRMESYFSDFESKKNTKDPNFLKFEIVLVILRRNGPPFWKVWCCRIVDTSYKWK